MYPFFSGLGGYVFGTNSAGNLDPSNIGVANKAFLKNATLIDKWNKEGLINSTLDYSTRAERVPEEAGRVLDHGPVGHADLEKSGIKFKIIQLPKIVKPSVPFLGVQGMMVTKYASTHGVDGARAGLRRRTTSSTPAAQTRARRCERPFPGEHQGGKRSRPGPRASSARRARAAFRCRTSRRWRASGATSAQAWVRSTKGSGAMPAARSFKGGCPLDRRQDRLAEQLDGAGVLTGAPLLPHSRPVSATTAPTAVAPAVVPERRVRAADLGLLGHGRGRRSRSRCSRCSNALAVWAVYVLSRAQHWVAVGVLVVATAADRPRLPRRRAAGRCRRSSSCPGRSSSSASRSSRSSTRSTSRSRTTRRATSLTKADGDQRDRGHSLQPPANGKTSTTMAPARDAAGQLVLILQDDATEKVYVGHDRRA